MYFNCIQGIQLSPEDSKTMEDPHSKSNSQIFQGSRDLNGMTTKKESINQDSGEPMGIQTRLALLEETQNDLIKSVNDFIQTSKDNQNKVVETLANMNTQMKEAAVKYDTLESVVKSLNAKIEFIKNPSSSTQNKHSATNQLQEDIHSIKRAASLLAITQIKFEELPYTMHCERDYYSVDFQSHMDACIQTRVDELFRHFNDVLDFHVMLVGGSGPHEGTVEIVYKDIHGTICDRYWDIKDAKVVCNMLGYKGARQSYRDSYFGNGTGQILFDEVACTSKEGSLLACRHRGIGGNGDVSSYCDHGDDAGVKCRM